MMCRKLTNEELETFVENCFPYSTGSSVIVDKEALKSICNELIEKRKTQEKLISLLQKADKHSDRLEWKLFMNELPTMVESMAKNKNKELRADE